MEILLLSKTRGKLGRLSLCGVTLFAGIVTVVVFAGTTAYAGYRYAVNQVDAYVEASISEQKSVWQEEMAEQKSLLSDASEDAQLNLNALAANMGKMQAKVSRLDALGSRLVSMADLDDSEFAFESIPGVGGPEQPESIENSMAVPDFLEALGKLSTVLETKEDELNAMEALLIDRKLQKQIFPEGLPVFGGWMTSGFGNRTNPIDGKREFHRGLDYAGNAGADVLSVGAGIVTWSGRRSGYGNVVEINHGNDYITRYAHNKKNLVSVGDKVEKGQVIAQIGSTGRSTGPHVHFEVEHNGKFLNPKKFINAPKS